MHEDEDEDEYEVGMRTGTRTQTIFYIPPHCQDETIDKHKRELSRVKERDRNAHAHAQQVKTAATLLHSLLDMEQSSPGQQEAESMSSDSMKPLTFTDFLEKMRAPAAMDLVRSIKSFINEMLNSNSNVDVDSQRVQEFLARSEAAFRTHPLWSGSSYEEFEAAGEGLEKYLMTKLYGRCFGVAEEDKERDALLMQRMKALASFLKPQHLDIPEIFCNESAWILAQKELQKINTYKAPRDKLVCILNCCRVISNLLSMSANEKGSAGADDFLPILIYVLIRASPPNLESNLAYIRCYRFASRLNGETAYFYTNMVSATSFIETIDASSLSIDPSEFIAHMQAAGVPGSKDLAPFNPVEKAETNASSSAVETLTATPIAEAEVEQMRHPEIELPPLIDLEERGSSLLLEAESTGELHMKYKYLYASVQDLKVKDISSLLEAYKELALRFESTGRAYNQILGEVTPSDTPVPHIVRAFHRVRPMKEDTPSTGTNTPLTEQQILPENKGNIAGADLDALANNIKVDEPPKPVDGVKGIQLPNPPLDDLSLTEGSSLPRPPADTSVGDLLS